MTFQSTHPLRGATPINSAIALLICISIHAPLAGCDITIRIIHPQSQYFNPRTPCGVRQISTASSQTASTFQSTHPLRGATDDPDAAVQGGEISIHAPLAGCDRVGCCGHLRFRDFNPRTPCGVRLSPFAAPVPLIRFQSTHPLRGATSYHQKY